MHHLPEHHWQYVTLPARYFSWRARGNALSFYARDKALLAQPYDLIVATSMVDLVGLRGLIPQLANTPCFYFFHENQFAYPDNSQQQSTLELQLLSIYNALSAERVCFNSAFNQQTFVSGAKALLKKMPDFSPQTLADEILTKSQVIPVPVEPQWFVGQPKPNTQPLKILWAHRREWDKGPDRLLAIVEQLCQQQRPFELHLAGQQFRQQPDCFAQLAERLQGSPAGKLIDHGFIEDEQAFRAMVQQCDISLSTALHDFQGLSMIQSAASRLQPVAPDRLAYPEFFPAANLYQSDLENIQQEAKSAVEVIMQVSAKPTQHDLSQLSWQQLKQCYATAFNLTGAHSSA